MPTQLPCYLPPCLQCLCISCLKKERHNVRISILVNIRKNEVTWNLHVQNRERNILAHHKLLFQS